MRAIEFRGRRTSAGEWVYGSLDQTIYTAVIMWMEGNALCKTKVAPETVGQYTGLKDINGVKIFEGDIVRDSSGPAGVVSYHKKTASFIVTAAVKNKTHVYGIAGSAGLQVTGNVHDNPEPL